MPELPEVETVKRGLELLLIGHRVKAVSFDTAKSFPNPPGDVKQFLIEAKVTQIRRRAKVLLIDLSTNYTLVIHLKMTGQLVFVKNKQTEDRGLKTEEENLRSSVSDLPSIEAELRFGAGHPNDSLVGKLPDRSTRVVLELDKDAKLFFNDQRKFGWVRLYPTVEVPSIDFMKRVGPEPLEDSFTPDIFIERLQRRKRSSIKAVLLDQTVLAGVGNIYADESLWGAKIHPAKLVQNIDETRLKKLFNELIYVLKLSIEKGGSTDKNYVNAEGKKGSYIDFARVFRKEGTPCPRHPGVLIEKIRVAGRGTHICPKCQAL